MSLDAVRDSELLGQLSDEEVASLEALSTEVRFGAGEVIFEEDGAADTFYLIVHGKVGLELTSPGGPPLVLQTLRDGEIVGVTWFFQPYNWEWRARALAETTMVAFDAERVRGLCVDNCELERRLLRSIAKAIATRLHSARTQLLDLYGSKR
jgi:CRP-like cAMP-binding protein